MKSLTICSAKHKITPTSPPIKPCMDCKHFQPSKLTSNIKYGKCLLFGLQDLVDGTIEYEFAGIAREYKCKGHYFDTQTFNYNQTNLWDTIDLDPPRMYDK